MKKRHLRVLEQINKSIPQALLEGLVVKMPAFSTLKQVAEAALTDPNTSEEDRKACESILKSGYLDKIVDTIDQGVEKQIDEYLDLQIKQAVEEGLLPASIKIPRLKRKAHKHVRHETKKIRDSRKD